MQNIPIGKLLVANGLLSSEQLEAALQKQSQSPEKRLGDILLEENLVSEKDLMLALQDRLQVRFIELGGYHVKSEAVNLVSEEAALQGRLIPIDLSNGVLLVATAEPMDLPTLEELRHKTGYRIQTVLATPTDIEEAIRIYYSTSTADASRDVNDEFNDGDALEDDFADVDVENAPVVKFINTLMRMAVKIGASDIHIEPLAQKTRVRMRVDGRLFDQSEITPAAHQSLITRMKIISGMDIAERRLPQDGRTSFQVGRRSVDVRVSSIPTVYGEKVALRILGGASRALSVGELGMDSANRAIFDRISGLPHGMLLVCGPTGSGKTTTLYALLKEISTPAVNVVTIEDPVEYEIEGINQIQVNNRAGLTFATGLRSILRQDPDIILVGEVRDEETARIAINAAVTGHIVLSTIHTNDAAGTVARFANMGVPRYLVSAAVAAVISQRLVRKLCKSCKAPSAATEPEKALLGEEAPFGLMRARGCPKCGHTGFSGRTAVFEILPFTSKIRELIDSGAATDELRAAAAEEGATSLRESCKQAVLAGEIAIDELARVTFAL